MGSQHRSRRAGAKPADVDGDSRVDAPSFPIVGIGASAGGLEAVSQLLQHIPAAIGMALCIVQHLDPTHESMLVELLRPKSLLPISEVVDGVLLEPDHAYVIPPDCDLRLEDGRLRLRARDHGQRPPMPIDGFFHSAASGLGGRAIGIVLSGAASDGTLGLAAIKAEGGITFAQDPASAKYDGMPRAAIAAGAVDLALTPAAIAAELVRIGRHPDVDRLGLALAATEQPGAEGDRESKLFAQLLALLRQAFGVDFTDYKLNTIARRVSRRMVLRRSDHLEDYLALVRDEPAELEALFQDILIMVTEFFREPETFAVLRRELFPRLLEDRSRDSELRIWVPGCASGEEAYSLAMALTDFLEERAVRPPVRVFATDVNGREIERARAGFYAQSSADSLPPGYLERFFAEADGGYQVVQSIRERCVFASHDITRDPPFSRLDLISCRNLLIYLGPALQRRVIPTLHYALRRGGYLVLGSSESVGDRTDLFEVLDKKHRIYRARAGPAHRVPAEFWPAGLAAGAPAAWQAGRAPAEARPGAAFDLEKAADEIVLSSFAPPGVIVNERLEIVQFRGRTEPYLGHPGGRASLDLLAMARPELAAHLGSAIGEARRRNEPVSERDVLIGRDEREELLHIHVVPVPTPAGERYFAVLFERAQQAVSTPESGGRSKGRADQEKRAAVERELAATRDYLQTVIEDKDTGIEELRAANEEIQSSNEELQSINEELETAKEELQSTNEELVTVNDELTARNAELSALSDDLSNLLASADIPIAMVDRDLQLRRITPAAETLLGMAPGARDPSLADVAILLDVPDLADLVRAVIDNLTPLQRDGRDREGRWRSLRITAYKTAEKTIAGAVVSLLDIDELKRSLEQIQEAARMSEALARIHRAISSTLEIDEILTRAVAEGAAALQAETASIVVPESGAWTTRYAYGYPPAVVGTRFGEADLPHLALAVGTKAPVAISHAGDDHRIKLEIVKLLELRSVLAVPLISKDEATGVLLFNWHENRVDISAAQIEFAAKLAASVSLALENARMYAERSQAVRLAEALNAIGVAISLTRGVEPILRMLAREGLGVIGCEGAAALLAEDDEFVVRVTVGAAEPLLGERFGRGESPVVGQPEPTREPFVANDAAHDPRLAPGFAARFGLRSLLFVPLVTREGTIAVLAFANLGSTAIFTEDHARFAAALANSGALAIENARAYEIEHRTAEALRKLLALPVPEIVRLRVGTAHRAAAADERVGGDFFDVFAVNENTTALLIADVSGKGVRAAGFTETVRSAVRTLTYMDPSPAVVLEKVNQSLMRQATDELFATAALFVIDAESGTVRYSSAGHPPAVICGDGCTVLPTDPGVPLGTFDQAYVEHSLHLEQGKVLIAYTDGITEARRGKKLFGEARTLAQLAKAKRGEPQDLVDGLLAAAMQFAGGKLADDAAIIAVSLVAEES